MKIDTFINAVRKLESRALSRSLSSKEQRQLEAFVDMIIQSYGRSDDTNDIAFTVDASDYDKTMSIEIGRAHV